MLEIVYICADGAIELIYLEVYIHLLSLILMIQYTPTELQIVTKLLFRKFETVLTIISIEQMHIDVYAVR